MFSGYFPGCVSGSYRFSLQCLSFHQKQKFCQFISWQIQMPYLFQSSHIVSIIGRGSVKLSVVVCPFTDKFRKRSGFLGKGFYCMDKLKIFPIFIIILICYMNIKGKCILQYVHFINSYFKFYCKCSSVKIKIWFQPYFSISASLNQWKRLRNCLLLQ